MAARSEPAALRSPPGADGIPDDLAEMERLMNAFRDDPAQLDLPLPLLNFPGLDGAGVDAAGLPLLDPGTLFFDFPPVAAAPPGALPGSGSDDSLAFSMPLDASSQGAAAAPAPAPASAPAAAGGRKPTPAERNRAAQKRFRERQKAKMSGLTGRMDELSAEVERLRAELAAARSRASLLTKVVSIRDDQLRLAAAERQLFDMAPSPAGGDLKALVPVPACGSALPPSRALLASGQVSKGTLEVPLSAAEVRAIKAAPPEAMVARWKELVARVGDALATLEACADGDDPAAVGAADAIALELNRMGEICWLSAVFAPRNIHAIMAATMDGGASGARADDPAHWAAVAAGLECTGDQRRELDELRRRYAGKMRAALAERRRVMERLRGVGAQEALVAQHLAVEMMDASEAALELKTNLQEVHAAASELIATALRHVLTPRQKARAIVNSYPFYPDIYQIATAVCGGAGGDA